MNDKPWIKHYDEGVPASLQYPEKTLPQVLRDSAARYPAQSCTIYQDAKISFSEMDELSSRLAAGLINLDIQKGDRVGVLLPNRPEFVIAAFGIFKAGAVLAATNMLYQPNEIRQQVENAGVKLMICAESRYAALQEIRSRTPIQRILVVKPAAEPSFWKQLQARLRSGKQESDKTGLAAGDLWFSEVVQQTPRAEDRLPLISPKDTAILQYTGGTTGTPKGAVGSHENLVANAIQFRRWLVNVEDGKEVTLAAIPLSHVYGMVLAMVLSIYCGAAMALVENPRDMGSMLETIQKYKASIFPGVPTLYNAINNHPKVRAGEARLDSIKACISGSAPLMKATKEQFEALTGGKLVEGYGLSEAPTATHCNPILGENRTGSIGLPLPDVEARIVSLEDGMTVLPAHQIGELVVKGPQVMKGYHNMPFETLNTLKEGWLYTGDIAYMDEDGYFYLIDRKKEVIKTSGFQVWPREVEEVISQHPKVSEAAVAGIPDAYQGEAVKAWVVVKMGETVSEEEIQALCRKELAPYKVPSQVEFRTELPKTLVGKTLRRELARQHREAQAVNAKANRSGQV